MKIALRNFHVNISNKLNGLQINLPSRVYDTIFEYAGHRNHPTIRAQPVRLLPAALVSHSRRGRVRGQLPYAARELRAERVDRLRHESSSTDGSDERVAVFLNMPCCLSYMPFFSTIVAAPLRQ